GASPLAAAYARRDDPVLRANLAVALGVACHIIGFSSSSGVLGPDAVAKAAHPLLRAALAVGNAMVARDHTSEAGIEELLRGPAVVVPGDVFFPWCHGDVFELAATTLKMLGSKGVDALTAGLLARVARPDAPASLRDTAADWLLSLHLRYRQ